MSFLSALEPTTSAWVGWPAGGAASGRREEAGLFLIGKGLYKHIFLYSSVHPSIHPFIHRIIVECIFNKRMVPLLIDNYSGSSVSLLSSFSFFTGWRDFYCSYHPRFVALPYVQGCVSWTRTDESTFEDKYFQVWTLNSGNPSLISSAIHYVWLWSAWPLFSFFQWSGWSLAKFERIPLVGGTGGPACLEPVTGVNANTSWMFSSLEFLTRNLGF